jgi:hypothetical protein
MLCTSQRPTSDFAKLEAVKEVGTRLAMIRINAPNVPVRVAFAFNAHFLYKRQHYERTGSRV